MDPLIASSLKSPAERRLSSWKEIAAHLGVTERTARRWEAREGLPVHRHLHDQRSSVYAYEEELERWLVSRKGPTLVAPAAHLVLKHWIALLAAAILCVVAVAVWFGFRSPDTAEQAFRPVPITTYKGMEGSASFSPDGAQVAFQWAANNSAHDIYIKDVRGEGLRRLTENPAPDGDPAWSPDGASIAFLRMMSQDRFEIRLISPLGGPERLVAETWVPLAAFPVMHRYITWTIDSAAIISPGRVPDTGLAGLYLFTVADRSRRLLTASAKGESYRSPALSPDGRTLVFERVIDWARTELCTLALTLENTSLRPPRCLGSSLGWGMAPAWGPDGKSLFFSRIPLSHAELFQTKGSDMSRAVRVNLPERSVLQPAFNSRTGRLAYTSLHFDQSIWQYPLRGETPAVDQGKLWMASSAVERSPQYSPDGSRVAFVSNRSGTDEIWIAPASGGEAVRATTLRTRHISPPAWSPDASQLAFVILGDSDWELLVIPVAGGQPRRIAGLAEPPSRPGWSRDGASVYVSNRAGGRQGIFRVRLDQASPPELVVENARHPRLSADGRFLYFLRRSPGPILRLHLASGAESEFAAGDSPITIWSPLLGSISWRRSAAGCSYSSSASLPGRQDPSWTFPRSCRRPWTSPPTTRLSW